MSIPGHVSDAYWILGRISDNKVVDNEAAGIIALAWRCLYAEITKKRIEGGHLNLQSTYARLVGMILSRLKANGYRWKRWYHKIQHMTNPKDRKVFPKKYRKRKLMVTQADAQYRINPELFAEFRRIKND